MELIYYNGFRLEAEYIAYRPGTKIFICQDKLVFTNKDNQVISFYELHCIIKDDIDKIINEIEK